MRKDSRSGSNLTSWFVAVLFGTVAAFVPYLNFAESPGMKSITCIGCFFVLGWILGLINPDDPWPWVVVCLIPLPVVDLLVSLPADQTVNLGALLSQFIQMVTNAENTGTYLLRGLAASAGAFAGTFGASHRYST